MSNSSLEAAAQLSEELLTDIELARLAPMDIVRKASRLARLLNKPEDMEWLKYEVVGYPRGAKSLNTQEWHAAERSGRAYLDAQGGRKASAKGLGELQSEIDTATLHLASMTGDISPSNQVTANNLRNSISLSRSILDRVIGSIYEWTASLYQEMRFGRSVEGIFETLRGEIDSKIVELTPLITPILSTAFENASSDDPEQWKHAAGACRDLLIAVADTLRPAGKEKNGIKMGKQQYVNRLIDWILEQKGGNLKRVAIRDLEDLGNRLDALTDGGNKGHHANVSKYESSRFITGTYLVLGDILNLKDKNK